MPYYTATSGGAQISVSWQRTYDERQPAWLITLSISQQHCAGIFSYPQSRAVVDDFGTLVAVREFK